MTRKDYVMISNVIRQTLADIAHDRGSEGLNDRGRAVLAGERAAAHTIALRLADQLRQDNPRFDRTRFMAACGLTA